MRTILDYLILYIGPGMGGGLLAVIWGILLAFFLSIIAIFWTPIKKIIRFFKSRK
jgi:hypothetical protein